MSSGRHEPYQFGKWEAAVYDQDPDRFAANYFGMTVPEYRKWVIEGPGPGVLTDADVPPFGIGCLSRF
jgi:hypothetical protein